MRFADDQIGKFYGFLTTLVVGLALNAPASATEVVADGWKVIEFPGIAPSRFVRAPNGNINDSVG